MKLFSAVLLAGGRSSRMGRDKALLPLSDGRLLWQRQLAVLEALGPQEIFFSGAPRAGLPERVQALEDRAPHLGPLAGLVAAFERMSTPLLVALAVDLPEMTADFLTGLIDRERAAVPMVRGRLEPLAASYSVESLQLASESLAGQDRSLANFVQRAQAASLLDLVDVLPEQEQLFVNWNAPADYNFQRPA